jgi:hypothetical protein
MLRLSKFALVFFFVVENLIQLNKRCEILQKTTPVCTFFFLDFENLSELNKRCEIAHVIPTDHNITSHVDHVVCHFSWIRCEDPAMECRPDHTFSSER